jgi:hypothetical protein
MKAVNDELLCVVAQRLIKAKGKPAVEIEEITLRNMLNQREIKRNLDLLNQIKLTN